MNAPLPTPLKFDSPATYQIVVHGYIAARSTEYLEGMSIRQIALSGEPPVTALEGELLDQAALAGVLNTLYDMHLPVLSVQCLRAGESNDEFATAQEQLPERSTTHG
ncbi:MAG: hypothetical protein V9H69_19190 [Anaerolineae bacterium]|jgi:hypothetical protein